MATDKHFANDKTTNDKDNRLAVLLLLPLKFVTKLVVFAITGFSILLIFYFGYWLFTSYDETYHHLSTIYTYQQQHFHVNDKSALGYLITISFDYISNIIEQIQQSITVLASNFQLDDNFSNIIQSSIDENHLDSNVWLIIKSFFLNALVIIQLAFLITVIKLLTSLGFYQLYLIALILGVITGNHKRLYRRVCGDRESQTKHEIIKQLMIWVPYIALIFYLVTPILLNPFYIALISSFVLYVLIHYLIGSFKKYV